MNNVIKDVNNYDDFKKVFLVFCGAPFFENWKEDELRKEYEYLKQNGEIYGYYLNNLDMVGLVSIIYGAVKDHPLLFTSPEKTIYLSDIAIIPTERGNGYAKILADFILDYANKIKYYLYSDYNHLEAFYISLCYNLLNLLYYQDCKIYSRSLLNLINHNKKFSLLSD